MKTAVAILAAASLANALFGSDDPNPYLPYNTSCPPQLPLTRKADSLSPGESDWLNGRDAVTKPALIDWLNKSNLSDFDANSFLSNGTIHIGLAYSGGGYRAMLAGAGQLAALDSRTENATSPGHLGGLLQATTYLAGLSGGNWLVASVVVNNWSSVQDLQSNENAWDISHSLFAPGGWNVFQDADFWSTVVSDINDKGDAGWNTSLTDLWGRALGYQLFDFEDGGRAIHYSYVKQYDAFTQHQMPFPIHVADRRTPGSIILSTNSSVFEINPFEIGSWDPEVYYFSNLEFMGTTVNAGQPQQDQCASGFDNVGFVAGTSATLFNQFILQINTTGVGETVQALGKRILGEIGEDGDDISIWGPNPFEGLMDTSNSSAEFLSLVDGGEDGENIPLHPLIQPQRNVDIIFAFDNSADTYADNPLGANLPDGASLIASYQRQFGAEANNTFFPYVPDNVTFIYGGLTLRPTFFGCDRDNLTSLFPDNLPESERYYPPVIAYIPNQIHSYQSNTTTFTLAYDTVEVGGMIRNGYETMTQNNGTTDPEWRSCIACAVILREQQRRGESPSAQCNQCFSNYCWDGKTVEASGTPSRPDGKNNTPAGETVGSGDSDPAGGLSPAPTVSVNVYLVAFLAVAVTFFM